MNNFPKDGQKLYDLIKSKIDIEKTTDVEINEDNDTYVQDIYSEWRNIGKTLSYNDIKFLSQILASTVGRTINEKTPYLDCEIPTDGARINITIPPLTKNPTLSLRFHHIAFRNLETLVEKQMLTKEEALELSYFVKTKKNIIVAGGTNSGKSTLLNALCNCIPEKERIIIIEDTREIYLDNIKNTTYLTAPNEEASVKCVEISLRKNPDRIIYGEVRGAEALSLIEAWNTGHQGGIATIHTNSAEAVFTRLRDLCGHKSAMDQSASIKEAVDIIVYIGFENGRRKVLQILDTKKSSK